MEGWLNRCTNQLEVELERKSGVKMNSRFLTPGWNCHQLGNGKAAGGVGRLVAADRVSW